ncbi:MAG: exodeoxyribonuclease VII large subunit [Lachnospiraceae bacterium]|nr:exodeoxyribonuclease VII large subunit [Lachnospiraceae bacterium]
MNVYTVAQINSYIKNMFQQDILLRSVCVKGEASNVKYHSSGHIYFTLKDKSGAIRCVMFAGNRSGLSFHLEEGQQILVLGHFDVYERDGGYQLYARQIRLEGAGALYEKFERLKKELEERGMFDPSYKRPIPSYVRRVGVVTAPTGKAIQDILTTARMRNPFVQIILYPARVQGEGAAPSIVNGIHALEALGVDVMIVGRGGGSVEEMWAFNEEIVAQAIFDCSVPIISAVGHETDFSISDFVADLRAITPTAAAVAAVPEIAGVLQRMDGYYDQLQDAMQYKLKSARQLVGERKMRLNYLSPMNRLKEHKQKAQQDRQRLMRAMQTVLSGSRSDLLRKDERTRRAMDQKLVKSHHALNLYIERLKGLSPLDKLNQGYSYTAAADGKTLNSIRQVREGDLLSVYVQDGKIEATVQGTQTLTYGSTR